MSYSHNPILNLRLKRALQGLARDLHKLLGNRLQALVLGGGYGRGEGGVRPTPQGPQPYNDLDLFLITDRRGALPAGLESTLEKCSQALGVEVDLGRPLVASDLQTWAPTLRWCELVHGHQVLHGPEALVRTQAAHLLGRSPEPVEALPLLLNRGAGLLWSLRVERGVECSPDPEFVRRNRWKAVLALGDALLLVHGRWQPLYEGRERRLAELVRAQPSAATFPRELYAEALEFKFRPAEAGEPPQAVELADWWARTLLHVEQHRLGRPWKDLQTWVRWAGLRESAAHTWRHLPRNVARNVRQARLDWRHPREALYRELPALLGLTGACPADWPRESADFLRTWSRCN